MARRKNQPDAVRAKFELAERLRTVRTELYGERGGPELARRLGVPVRTWYNYESGVTVPSELLLRFIELTAVEPGWLLTGSGLRFRTSAPVLTTEPGGEISVPTLLRTALQRLENQTPGEAGEARSAGSSAADPGHGAFPASFGDAGELVVPEGGGWLRVESNAMFPIVGEGAFVVYSGHDEAPAALEGRIVVAWIDGRPIVRWFEVSGRYALLRAENPTFDPPMTLLDLETSAESRRVRRIIWVGTSH